MTRTFVTGLWILWACFLSGCESETSTSSGTAPSSSGSFRSAAAGDEEADRAQLLIEERKFSEALPHLERALEQGLEVYSRSIVLTMIGICHYEMDEIDTALEYYDKALAEDATNHKAYVNKGIVYRLKGEYDLAKECYSKALELKPDYAELHASMGALAIYQNEYEQAVAHLERSIELDDSLAVAHSNLAVAYATVGRFDEADQELKKAVILGYHQPERIKERIDQLRKISEAEK